MEPRWVKMAVMVPTAHADDVRMAMFDAGAGEMGTYDCCSYNIEGFGTFRALDGANPFVGAHQELHHEDETKIEVIVPRWRVADVENMILQTHPYECPAIDIIPLDNRVAVLGLGVVGNLDTPMTPDEFLRHICQVFDTPVVRHSPVRDKDVKIRRVALCGGSGGEFIKSAIKARAQAYLTSDVRYHDFVDFGSEILIADIGHHDSERCTKDIFIDIIKQKFANFAVYKSRADVNPIQYTIGS